MYYFYSHTCQNIVFYENVETFKKNYSDDMNNSWKKLKNQNTDNKYIINHNYCYILH